MKPKIHPNAVKNIQRAPADHFGEINDTIRDAARMTEARRLSAEAVRERCNSASLESLTETKLSFDLSISHYRKFSFDPVSR